MKTTKTLFWLLGILLMAIACTPESEVEEATLSLSETGPIVLENGVLTHSFTATTNQRSVTAYAKDAWLDVNVSGTTISLVADVNVEPAERRTNVIVMASGAISQIQVVQPASELSLVLMPDMMTVDQWEGKYTFDVECNSSAWEATVDQDWVRVFARPHKKEVAIEVDEIMTRESRTAKIKVAAEGGKVIKEFELTQKGVMYWILPYLDFTRGTRNAIYNFEKERRSELSASSLKTYDFRTRSAAFTDVWYFVEANGLMTKVQMNATSDAVLDQNNGLADLLAFLKENGFTESQGTNRLFNPTLKVIAEVKKTFRWHILFTYVPDQPAEYKTFDEMPYGFIKWGASEEEIKAYEAEHGGVFSETESIKDEVNGINMLVFKFPSEKVLFRRQYFTGKDMNDNRKLIGVQYHYLDFGLAYWLYNGQRYLTNEFRALLAKEGFVFTKYEETKKRDVFVNRERGLGLATRIAQFQGDANPVLELWFSPLTDSSTSSTMSDEELLRRFSQDGGQREVPLMLRK